MSSVFPRCVSYWMHSFSFISNILKQQYTLLYFKWITNKDLLYSRGNSVQCYVAAWVRGVVWGRTDTCIYLAESLCCPPETITALLISYPPKQNKKFRMKTKKSQQPKHILMQFSGFMDPVMLGNANWEIITTKWNSQCYSIYSLNLFKVRLAHVSSAAAKTKGFGDWRERKGKTTFFFSFQLVFQGKGLTQQVGSQGTGKAKAVCNAQTTGSEHTHTLSCT